MKNKPAVQSKSAVLEYRATKPRGRKKTRWGFRFLSPEGETLVESSTTFDSKREAERGFVSMIKFIASNAYRITTTGKASPEVTNN